MDGDINNFEFFFKTATYNIIELKGLNRCIILNLEERRRELEQKRSVVDHLELNLENLQYKEAFLNREISACKDLETPGLNEIEKELKVDLGTKVYVGNLDEVHERTVLTLHQEKADRVSTQDRLHELLLVDKRTLDQLERKRKFVDDMPSKMLSVINAAAELQAHFETIGKD